MRHRTDVRNGAGSARPGSGNSGPGRADADTVELTFTIDDLGALRRLVSRMARSASLDAEHTEGVTLAVNELAANSIRHGGGSGTLRMWRDDTSMVCEVQDRGHIAEPWKRHVHPGPAPSSGRGLWLVGQLCDIVQIRSSQREGSTVRVSMLLPSVAV